MQPDPNLIEAALSLGCDPSEIVLMLRTCNERLQGYGGFQWPAAGLVAAPDWSAEPVCGAGLHGFLYGVGEASLANWANAAHWLVVAVPASEIVSLDRGEKYKFPRAFVLHASQDRYAATQYLHARLPPGTFPVMGISLVGGDRSTLTGGRGSVLAGGDHSTLVGGDYSTLTGGYGSTLTGGRGSTLTGGHSSTLTGGHYSILTGGEGAILTGGEGAALTGGHYSTLTGGYGSTLTGGYGSTLTGGHGSTLTGGEGSALTFRWRNNRARWVTAYVGEGGIASQVAYRCSDSGVIERA